MSCQFFPRLLCILVHQLSISSPAFLPPVGCLPKLASTSDLIFHASMFWFFQRGRLTHLQRAHTGRTRNQPLSPGPGNESSYSSSKLILPDGHSPAAKTRGGPSTVGLGGALLGLCQASQAQKRKRAGSFHSFRQERSHSFQNVRILMAKSSTLSGPSNVTGARESDRAYLPKDMIPGDPSACPC